MKLTHKLMVALSALMFTGMSATKAEASNFRFTQGGWSQVSSDTVLSGSFSGTPRTDGEINLSDLTAFNANFDTSSNLTRSWDLEDVSQFTYNPVNDLLTFSANNSDVTITRTPINSSQTEFITTTQTLGYNIDANSDPLEPSRFFLNVSIDISQGVGNINVGTVFSSVSFETPQVFQISNNAQQIPESSTIGAVLVAVGMGATLRKSKKKVPVI